MARLNTPVKTPPAKTHEGGRAQHINAEQKLRRSVLACMLWEDTFYEDGEQIADRIAKLVPLVSSHKVVALAIEARTDMKLRHVPLLIAREMARCDLHKSQVAHLLSCIIQRPDEITEFLAIYSKDGAQPLSAQVKKGLARAFLKFDEYQLSKWDRPGKYTLKDALFLCHAKPDTKEREALWKRLIDGKLAAPDTWEVSLSAGKDKKETWTRLLSENKMPAFAMIKNLRNMQEAGVDHELIARGLETMKAERILPFRFIMAARAVPSLEPEIEKAMLRCLDGMEKIPGDTVLLVDVSGSMEEALPQSKGSYRPINRNALPALRRIDAACGLAILARELCERVRIFTFSFSFVEVAGRHGFALRDAIVNSQEHEGTYLGHAIRSVYETGTVLDDVFRHNSAYPLKMYGAGLAPDRLIVLTDEQAHDDPKPPPFPGYMINVASYENGVGYHGWSAHITGWSEAVLKYITEFDRSFVAEMK